MRYLALLWLTLVILLFVSACDDKLLTPDGFNPDNANSKPMFVRNSLMDNNGNCYTGYRNLNIQTDRVSLTWNKSTGSNFLGYRLFRDNQFIQLFPYRGQTAFTDTLLDADHEYTYTIATVVRTGLSAADTLTVKTASDAPPVLVYRINSDNRVILNWTDPSDIPGSFRIYRNAVEIAEVQEATPTDHEHVYRYQDNNAIQFQNYQYTVQKEGVMDDSEASSQSIYVNYFMNTPVLTSLHQEVGTTHVSLIWNENSSSETGFNIYRKTEDYTAFNLIATLPQINANSFLDETNLVPDNTYYYYITAIDTDSYPVVETPHSNILQITIVNPQSAVWQLALRDYYVDGWTGGYMSLYVNNEPVIQNVYLDSGTGPEYWDFVVHEGDAITTSYSPGSYSYENYYAILDQNGDIVAESGGTWNNPGQTTPQSIYTPIIVHLGAKSSSATTALRSSK